MSDEAMRWEVARNNLGGLLGELREEHASLFDHGYITDAAVVARRFGEVAELLERWPRWTDAERARVADLLEE